MAENTILLVMRLEGAMQSWGESSKWDYRDTSTFPTKSGIVGLIGCAMGISRGDSKLIEISDAIRIAVRADRAGTKMIDFHTVTGNPLRCAKKKNGKREKRSANENTIISKHAYLQDASFLVLIETEDSDLRERIKDALNAPRWCIYLGRKNCVPSRPVFEDITSDYSDLLDAIKRYPFTQYENESEERKLFNHNDEDGKIVFFESEKGDSNLSQYTRTDKMILGNRSFTDRQAYRGIIEFSKEKSEEK